ncbi:hypothetical protein [Enemella sp. A6]|uniref:hypothetical protein n=1 Tax=Enemella sp. A6 TaxID=3440152 RepID=UPI003EBB84EE
MPDTPQARVEVPEPDGTAKSIPSDDVDGPIVISNEFADVVVRRVKTRNGTRLEIASPRRGARIHLDAVALDCLSYSEPELITSLLSHNPGTS